MMKMNLQYFGHLMWIANTLEKTLMLGKIEGRRRRGRQRTNGCMASLTQWTWIWASSGRWWRTGEPGTLQSKGSQRVRHNWATAQQQQPSSPLLSCLPSIDNTALYLGEDKNHHSGAPCFPMARATNLSVLRLFFPSLLIQNEAPFRPML